MTDRIKQLADGYQQFKKGELSDHEIYDMILAAHATDAAQYEICQAIEATHPRYYAYALFDALDSRNWSKQCYELPGGGGRVGVRLYTTLSDDSEVRISTRYIEGTKIRSEPTTTVTFVDSEGITRAGHQVNNMYLIENGCASISLSICHTIREDMKLTLKAIMGNSKDIFINFSLGNEDPLEEVLDTMKNWVRDAHNFELMGELSVDIQRLFARISSESQWLGDIVLKRYGRLVDNSTNYTRMTARNFELWG